MAYNRVTVTDGETVQFLLHIITYSNAEQGVTSVFLKSLECSDIFTG